jgi:hypothetical protein
VNRVEFGLGVLETKNGAATPFSSLPFTCLYGTPNVPISDLGSVNFTCLAYRCQLFSLRL